MEIKRAEINILAELTKHEAWVLANRLPDGNGRPNCASGNRIFALEREGFIQRGKEPKHSLYGYKITQKGRAALHDYKFKH